MSRAVIGSRGSPFLSWRAYPKKGTTAVMRLADARLRASIMISCSMMWKLISGAWLCSTKQSAPRTDSAGRA